jgi:hypothetical protein
VAIVHAANVFEAAVGVETVTVEFANNQVAF